MIEKYNYKKKEIVNNNVFSNNHETVDRKLFTIYRTNIIEIGQTQWVLLLQFMLCMLNLVYGFERYRQSFIYSIYTEHYTYKSISFQYFDSDLYRNDFEAIDKDGDGGNELYTLLCWYF